MTGDIKDGIQQMIDFSAISWNHAIPAEITAYNKDKNCIKARPLIQKKKPDGTFTSHSELSNIPVIFPSFKGGGLFFPVKKGDHCLLVFCHSSIEEWKVLGDEVQPKDKRRFDINDAIAIVGLTHLTKSKGNGEDIELIYGTSKISIKQDGTININTLGEIDILGSSINLGADISGEAGTGAKIIVDKSGKIDIKNATDGLGKILNDLSVAIAGITITIGGVPHPIDQIPVFQAITLRIKELLKT